MDATWTERVAAAPTRWRRTVGTARSGDDRRARPLAGVTELGAGEDEAGEQVPLRGNPVLLLRGLFSTPKSLKVLEHRLRRDGCHVLSIRLGGLTGRFNTCRIEALAEAVRVRVERFYSRHRQLGPLTVVGHSKGGLVAAYWVKRLGGNRFARAVVTLGTPHRGTPVAWMGIPLAPFVPSILQLVSRSAFVRRLHEGAWPAHVRLVSLYSRDDRLVPYPSALVEAHGQAHVHNVEVACSHKDFLLGKRAYAALLREVHLAAAPATAADAAA